MYQIDIRFYIVAFLEIFMHSFICRLRVVDLGLFEAHQLLRIFDDLDVVKVKIQLLANLRPDILDTLGRHGFKRLALLSHFEVGTPSELQEEARQQIVERPILFVDVQERADLEAGLRDDLEVVDSPEAEHRVDIA